MLQKLSERQHAKPLPDSPGSVEESLKTDREDDAPGGVGSL
jgi:hypothetical protein